MRKAVIRWSGFAVIVASASVLADILLQYYEGSAAAIPVMVLSFLAGSAGIALYHLQSAGRLAAALSLLGVILIFAANVLYGTDLGAFAFALGMLALGIASFRAGELARLVAVLWFVAAAMSFPPLLPATGGYNFVAFGLALLGLGYTLWVQAGLREVASTQVGPETSSLAS